MAEASVSGQIVAMGGSGFSMEPENQLMNRYVLSLAKKERPKICYLGQASGENLERTLSFYQLFTALDARPSHLSLFSPPTADLRGFVFEQDIIYAGGGNTKSMLALWREWALDHILREAWEQGKILAGVSAGSICWFEQGVTDSIPGTLSPLACMGFLAGSNCPHYDSEAERRPAYQRLVAEGKIGAGYACDDGVALHYEGTRLKGIISSRPHAHAYQLEQQGKTAAETALDPVYLGETE